MLLNLFCSLKRDSCKLCKATEATVHKKTKLTKTAEMRARQEIEKTSRISREVLVPFLIKINFMPLNELETSNTRLAKSKRLSRPFWSRGF